MPRKKKTLIEKIVKKNYNNELEKILEGKFFSEDAKSVLLSILYKIEASYADLQTVKRDVETKEEYISNILEIISKDCDLLKIVKMNDEESKIPKNKTYIINKSKKEIIAYPIERKILYAIAKIGNKDKIINDDYFIINETLSELINVGNNINMVEPLRDFNGYSWTSIIDEIESIDHNLVYQNLRILVGYQFLDKWVRKNEFIIDYFDLFKEELENRYGKENKNKIIDIISKISLLLSIKFNTRKKSEYIRMKENIEIEFKEIQDKEQFVLDVTERKMEVTQRIKEIDTILNNKELLEKEYKKRNRKLSLENKIFSMRVLSKMMIKEREEYLKELEKLNIIINPKKFTKYKKELEEKYEFFKILDEKNLDEELYKQKIKLQKVFLNAIKINIKKAETKQEMEKIIYDFRYYILLPFDNVKNIQKISDLKGIIKEVSKLIIEKAIDMKVLHKISSNKDINYEILKNIFNIRIIRLEDAYLKITKDTDKYLLQIFDENEFEEKINISEIDELEIKLNKKIAIFSN